MNGEFWFDKQSVARSGEKACRLDCSTSFRTTEGDEQNEYLDQPLAVWPSRTGWFWWNSRSWFSSNKHTLKQQTGKSQHGNVLTHFFGSSASFQWSQKLLGSRCWWDSLGCLRQGGTYESFWNSGRGGFLRIYHQLRHSTLQVKMASMECWSRMSSRITETISPR